MQIFCTATAPDNNYSASQLGVYHLHKQTMFYVTVVIKEHYLATGQMDTGYNILRSNAVNTAQ